MSVNPVVDSLIDPRALLVSRCSAGSEERFADGWRHRKHAPGTIIAAPIRGRYQVRWADGGSVTVGPGEAFLARDGDWLDIVHRADRRGGTMAARWLHLRVTLFGTLDACALLALPRRLERARATPLLALIDRLLAAGAQPGLAGAALRAESGLSALRLLATMLPPSAAGRRLLGRAERIAPLAAWLDSRLGAPLTVADLAAAAGLSPSRLHARLVAELGMPPMAWVRELRLTAARDRLLATSEAVAVVGAACGFPDQFHFSRAFRARFGVAPGVMRARHLDLEARDRSTVRSQPALRPMKR